MPRLAASVPPGEVESEVAERALRRIKGNGVSVIPMHAMLTTQEAADMLNVSRPYLIGLLEAGEIPHTKVGRHRRVQLEDLLDYQRRDAAERRRAADELSGLGQELGI